MSEHKRRKGYWKYYEMAIRLEQSHMIKMLIKIIQEMPCPREKKSDVGRPPIHSKAKLDFACLLLMMADNNTYRGVVSNLRNMRI